MTPRHFTVTMRTLWLAPMALIVLARPAHAGGLSFVQYLPPPIPINQALKDPEVVAVSADGANLYAASNTEDSLGVFTRNPTTGALTFLEVQEDGVGGVDGLRHATGVAVSPDGNCVYATSEQENKLAIFSRNLGTGALTFLSVREDGVGGVSGLQRPQAVVVSPDDLHVYVGAETSNAGRVVVFSRTPPACALTFVEAEAGDGSGLGKEVAALAVSADGAHVYTTGTFFDGKDSLGAVNALSRNAVTGALTFIEREYDGNNGVERLGTRPRGLAISPDGGGVYVTTGGGDSIVAFSRNAVTGDITFVEFEKDGGVNDGLKGVFGVAVSPDSAYVYVASRGDDAVAVFRRDTSTSALRFLEVQKDPYIDPPNDVLIGPSGVALSPLGDSLYAGRKGITVFAVDACGNGTVGVDEQCDDGNVLAGDGCSATCRLELCDPTPTVGCRGTAPLGAALQIKNLSPDTKDQLQWKWNKGDATMLAEYGNPTTSASYVLCLYDNTGLLLASAAPAGGACKKGKPCWKAATTSYKYNDGLLTPDGLQIVQLKEGLVNGKAKIQIKGKGINLLPPALPLTLPVTVQVKNTQTGVCWDAVYTTADTNDTEKFKAKGN